MANTCSNFVSFHGAGNSWAEKDNNIKIFIEQHLKHALNDFEENTLNILDISISRDDVSIYYETKNEPGIDFLIIFSKTYKLGFNVSYEELGNELYGEVKYLNDVLSERELTSSDFEELEYDDDTIMFRGDVYDIEDETEILDELLNEKNFTQPSDYKM